MFQPNPYLLGDKIPISEKRPKDYKRLEERRLLLWQVVPSLFLPLWDVGTGGDFREEYLSGDHQGSHQGDAGALPTSDRRRDVGAEGRCALLGWMTCRQSRQDQYRFEKLSNIIKQLASQESSCVFIESFLEFRTATWYKATSIMIYSIRKVHWSAKSIPSVPSWSLKSMVTDVTSRYKLSCQKAKTNFRNFVATRRIAFSAKNGGGEVATGVT